MQLLPGKISTGDADEYVGNVEIRADPHKLDRWRSILAGTGLESAGAITISGGSSTTSTGSGDVNILSKVKSH